MTARFIIGCCIEHASASGSLRSHRITLSRLPSRALSSLPSPFPLPVCLSLSLSFIPFFFKSFFFFFFFFRFNRLCVSIDLLRPRSHTRGLYKHRNIQTHIVLFSSFFFFFLFLLIFVSFFFLLLLVLLHVLYLSLFIFPLFSRATRT